MAFDAPPATQKCMTCRSVDPPRRMAWRCHDCFGDPVFCTHCIQECHQIHPFHRVSRWNGKCFIPSSLSNAGLTLNLGHGGNLCPVYQRLQIPALNATGGSSSKTTITDSLPDVAGLQNALSAEATPVLRSDDSIHTRADNHPALRTLIRPDLNGSSTSDVDPDAGHRQPACTAPLGHDTTIHSASLRRFWEVAGSTPYEATMPCMPDLFPPSHDAVPIGIADDPFFANESDDEESWKNVAEGGLPLKVKHDNRKYDKLHCPILTVVDVTGIHEMRVRFCRCRSLEAHPLQTQLMHMGMYASSSKRTRTVFTFRVLHHFDITNLEAKTTAWQYYSILQRLTSNVFTDTVADRYRELMRALRQWRDLSSRRRAGEPLEPGIEVKPGDLALFCPACPQPGINLPKGWENDTNQ